jgi:uncharacterized membrane protein YhdT
MVFQQGMRGECGWAMTSLNFKAGWCVESMGATCRNLKGIEPSWFLCATLPLGVLALFGLLFVAR